MAKIIALFNNKGGVSKTTTTFHLGWKLAELGYKTLMIDTDPQCNLTGLCLNADKENKLTQFYEAKNQHYHRFSIMKCDRLKRQLVMNLNTTKIYFYFLDI